MNLAHVTDTKVIESSGPCAVVKVIPRTGAHWFAFSCTHCHVWQERAHRIDAQDLYDQHHCY